MASSESAGRRVCPLYGRERGTGKRRSSAAYHAYSRGHHFRVKMKGSRIVAQGLPLPQQSSDHEDTFAPKQSQRA